jgi:hypothetical protein
LAYDVLNPDVRKAILNEILTEENLRRKEESLRRLEIYKQNQKRFIMQALVNEFSVKTVRNMRTLTSMNMTKRIIDQKASIYREPPERTFFRYTKLELTEDEIQQCKNIYDVGRFNVNFKTANRMFKLQSDQIHLQVIPQEDKIALRVLMPHHLDVVPSETNPDVGEVYITSVMDRSRLLRNIYNDVQGWMLGDYRDMTDQKIADPDDEQSKANQRFVWWTKEYNFATNGHGEIVNDENAPIDTAREEELKNPINMIPFVDVSSAKDYEYWMRAGSSVCDFAIEMGVMLSDMSNTMRLNGHIQGVIYSEKQPGTIAVGPNVFIHIPLDPDKPVQPRLEMLSPTAQIQEQMQTLESLIQLLIAQEGLDAKSMIGTNGGATYSSAIERLLALIEKFEASRDDIDAFSAAESQVFDIAKAWSNSLVNTFDEDLMPTLAPDLNITTIPDDTRVTVSYAKPEEMKSEKDKVDLAILQLGEGLITKAEAIAMIRDIPVEQAKQIAEEMDDAQALELQDMAKASMKRMNKGPDGETL